MPENNKGKYDIDELVNSLLMERQPELPREEPELNTTDIDPEDNPYIMDIAEEVVTETEEELSNEPTQLLDFEELDELAVAEADEEIRQADESFVSRIIEVPHEEKPADTMPRYMPVPELEIPAAPPIVTETPAAPKKRKKLFGRKEDDVEVAETNDWGLKPIGQYHSDDVPTPVEPVVEAPGVEEMPENPGATVDEFPAVKAAAETITMQVVLPSGAALPRGEEHTRIISTADESDVLPTVTPRAPVVESPVDDQLPDQLSLEEMVRVEDMEPTEDMPAVNEEEDPEERLQRAREEKVREFTFDGDEEEANEPDEEPAQDEESAIEDFTGYQDVQTIADELKYRCRSSMLCLLFSGVLEFCLLILTLLTVVVGQSPIHPAAYLTIHLFGLVLMMGLNYSTITRGLSGLFTLCANNDTAPSVASAVCLLNLILHLLNVDAPLPFWTPLAGLLLVMSAVAHHMQEVRVRRNFAFVSYSGDKYAAALIENEDALQEIGRRAVSDGEAKVAYFRRTGFLTDYLTNAYEEDCGDDWSRWLTPGALGLSLVLSLVSLLSESIVGVWGWLSVFTGMVCLSMPITLLAVQGLLSRSCRRMLSRGGFLNGWKAVRQFGQPDALVVDIADLYPDESMLLHGIKTFSGTHIDEAILTAASLAVRSGGPLAMIFRRIIENKEELLYEVDSLVYEQGMGLSGWVDGRRVFVGNGRLLQNHGVDVPSSDYEARYAKDGRRLVYLSIAGQLSAMFVVSYLPDPEIQSALQELCRARVTLLVRSCDPNITTSDLCDGFELDEYYVDVLPAAAGRMYVQLTEKNTDSLSAVMASNGHILGTARVLSACRSLKIKAAIALCVQVLAAVLGAVLCLIWAMNGTLSLFQPLLFLLLGWFFAWLIPLFRYR